MRIAVLAVLAATGSTGRHLLERALDRGHTVVALVPQPAAVHLPPGPTLETIQVDVQDGTSIAIALDGVDAVVSGLGLDKGGRPGTLTAGAVAQPAVGQTFSTADPPYVPPGTSPRPRIAVSRTCPPAFVQALADATARPVDFRADVERLLDELAVRSGRHAVALVSLGHEPSVSGGTTLTLDRDRHFTLMPWDVRLTANQLTAVDAQTLADLLTASDGANDEPMPPASGTQPFEEVADAAGALRPELTEPRGGGDAPDSLLTLPDQKYVTFAATTPADLAALAPVVAEQTRARVIALDQTLDDDLAAWYDPDTPRPRLRLLGPVELRASGERTADVNRRCAYFTEVVTYLATREHGATPEQVAEAFNVQTNTIHSRVGTVRKWLGTDPSTGNWYLPESTLSPSAKTRGVPVYEVIALLSDADLFKRLRVRGQARGQEGIDDLFAGLRLVEGRPFDQLRPGGYGWLAGTPLDQYLTAGVVDVAHIVATHELASGDVERA